MAQRRAVEHRVEVTGIFVHRAFVWLTSWNPTEKRIEEASLHILSFPRFEYIKHMNLRENSLYIDYPYKRSCPSG